MISLSNSAQGSAERNSTFPLAPAMEHIVSKALADALKEPTTRWDWVSTCPIHHLSFILGQCLPLHHISRSEVQRHKERILKGSLSISRNYSHEFDTILSGSLFEGLSLPSFVNIRLFSSSTRFIAVDLDMMVVAKEFIVANEGNLLGKEVKFYIESDATHPGYLRLRFANSQSGTPKYKVAKSGTTDYYLSTKMNDDLLEQMSEFDGKASSQKVSLHGPALTMEDDDKLNTLVVDTDNVFALPCPDWPIEASEWLDRPRPSGWPSTDLRDKIIKCGCHVVPVAHPKSSYRSIEWRFSFSKGEGLLVESLTDTQRQCYILVKMMLHLELKSPKVLVSYHLKNILLYVCEEVAPDQWREDNIGSCFLILLDKLLHCLIRHNIPNYFVSANNMIGHVDEDSIRYIARKVSQIRQNPVKYLLEFQNTYKFEFSPMTLRMEYFFEEVIQDIKAGAKNLENSVMKGFVPSILKLGSQHARDNRINDAIERFIQVPKIMNQYTMPASNVVLYLNNLVELVPEQQRINYLEHVASRYPNDKNTTRVLSNLGCYLFADACKKFSKYEKDLLQSRAESYFEKAASMPHFSSAGRVDFANFLCHTRNTKSAVPHLLQVIQEEKDNMTSSNGYDRYKMVTLDVHLQTEIDATGHIDIPSAIMAYYLLVNCLRTAFEAGEPMTENIVQVVDNFKGACTNVKDVPQKAFSFSLLGYALMDMQEHEKAAECFSEALKLKPDYTLAAENITIAKSYGK